MSWNAVRWATEADVPSPIMELILILLANKADDRFSCYSIRTLMAESCAGRSTFLGALKNLQVNGFVTRIAQFYESGGRRSGRHFLNHPDASHPSGEIDERI